MTVRCLFPMSGRQFLYGNRQEMSMQFTVNLPHQISFVPLGKRNSVSEWFFKECRLEVKEPSDEEAPVAVRWRYHDGVQDCQRRDGETRWHNGRHWAKKRDRDERPVSATCLSMIGGLGGHNNPLKEAFGTNLSRSRNRYFHDRDFSEGEVRSVERNGFEYNRKRCQEVLDRLIVIDGEIWEPVAEPRLALSVERIRGSTFEETVARNTGFAMGSEGYGVLAFRADRLDEACEVFDLSHDEARVDVDVLVSDSIKLNDDGIALLSAAHDLFNTTNDMVKWDWDRVEAFYRFRDAYMPFHRGIGFQGLNRYPTEDEFEEIFSTVTEYAKFFDPADVSEQMLGLDRWQNRPIAPTADLLSM